MDFRTSFDEEITDESWILRNTWQKVKQRYSHGIGLAKYPNQFKSTAIKTLLVRALQIQGIRPKLNLTNGLLWKDNNIVVVACVFTHKIL